MTKREQLDQWQLEGNSAEAYERYLVPIFFAPWAERLIELAALRQGERVLDVACGTGTMFYWQTPWSATWAMTPQR